MDEKTKAQEKEKESNYLNHEDQEELNTYHEDFEELPPKRPTILIKITALVTLVAFLGIVISTILPTKLHLADLASESAQLKKDINSSILNSVVQINVIAEKNGSVIAVEQKSGTGFNINPGGLIVTNHHVIDGALNMTITFPSGKVYSAEQWYSKPEYDLAVIKLRAENLPVVPVNNSDLPRPGDSIKVVGNPLNLKNIVAEGRVGRYLRIKGKPETVFTIDAPIYKGNSGSPVLNSRGEVVGVVFGILRSQEKDKAAGLAMPINWLLKMQED